jgi:hypothetical protein
MTPRQILMKKFKSQTDIAEAAGMSRQAVSIAFKRGRLSYEMASVLAKRMRVPVAVLLSQWVPDTNRRAKATPHVKRRLAIAAQQQP